MFHVQESSTQLSTNKGVLYLVGTPIGNLKDITSRALDTLNSVDIILSEDTRRALKLLNKFSIKKRLISFNEYNQGKRISKVKQYLAGNKKIAFISDAGMPGISDPGAFLVRSLQQTQQEISIIPVGGISSVSMSFMMSGFGSKYNSSFIFHGFLPSKRRHIIEVLDNYICINIPIIFFVTARNLKDNIDVFVEYFNPQTQICILRELTKVYENIVWTDIYTLKQKNIEDIINIRGEFSVVIKPHLSLTCEDDYAMALTELLQIKKQENKLEREVIKKVAYKYKLNINKLYKMVLKDK